MAINYSLYSKHVKETAEIDFDLYMISFFEVPHDKFPCRFCILKINIPEH